MRAPLFRSSLSRLVAGYVLVAIVLAGAWLYSLYGPLTTAVLSQQKRNLKAVAQSAALVVSESDESPQHIAKQLVARTDLRLTIVAADGRVIADSDTAPEKMENHGNRPEVRAALAGRTGVDQRTSKTEGDEQMYVAVPGSFGGRRVAVRVAQSIEDVRAIASRLRRFGMLALSLALGIVIFIAWRATQLAARPLTQLTEASQQMAAGNLSAVVAPAPSDLEGLAESLRTMRDQMKARLEALEAERRTLKAALDGLSDAVLVVENGTVSMANEAADAMAPGPQPAVVTGRAVDDLPLSASLNAAIRSELASPTPGGIELEPDPLGRAWRVVVAPLSSAVGGMRAIVVLSDVTERVRLDSVRREFVANASHELKTPVAGIKLLAESTAMASADGDEESAAVFAGQLVGEVERLQRLVGDLLDLSRLEALPKPGSVTDVRVAVDNALAGHRSSAVQKGLALEADLSAVRDDDVFVAADSTDVAVALDNLLGNAIAYTDAGSVNIAVTTSGDDVLMSVTDTGPGIAPEHLPRIFERFYRADEGRARDAGGTGLGLALVRHVAERNGGSATVTSEVGRGSVFVLRLPRHR